MGVLERGTTSPKEPSGNATLNPVEATTMPRAGMYSSCAKERQILHFDGWL